MEIAIIKKRKKRVPKPKKLTEENAQFISSVQVARTTVEEEQDTQKTLLVELSQAIKTMKKSMEKQAAATDKHTNAIYDLINVIQSQSALYGAPSNGPAPMTDWHWEQDHPVRGNNRYGNRRRK